MGDSDPEESSDGTTESEAEWRHMDDFETDPYIILLFDFMACSLARKSMCITYHFISF